MKGKLLSILFVSLLPLLAQAQIDRNMEPDYARTVGDESVLHQDSVYVNSSNISPEPFQWKIDERFGTVIPIEIDTTFINFPNTNHNEGMLGHYNSLGNLGSPRLSHVWNDRTPFSQLYFMDPYSFYKAPGEYPFTNSRLPYTNVTYFTAGGKKDAEENLKFYFSRNAGKKFSVGFNVDYLYSLGFYQNQSNSQFNGSLFAGYIGKHYEAKFLYRYYYLKLTENGGIVDDRYITDPEAMAQGTRQFAGREIPVVFDYSGASVWNRNRMHEVFVSQSYSLGFDREHQTIHKNDTTVTTEYIPVSTINYTLKFQTNKHTFKSRYDLSKNDTSFHYVNTYLTNDLTTNDSTYYTSFKNTLSLSLLEGFNKYAKAGLSAFIEYEYRNISMMPRDSLHTDMNTYNEHEVYIGGQLSKREGTLLHYNVVGALGAFGTAIGQFDVKGTIDLNFGLRNDTVSLVARGGVSNLLPAFYMRHYHSNHFRWDNDNMEKEFRTRVEGELSIKRWRTRLHASMENIKNYTFLNGSALPEQYTGNIQVLTASLNQDFKLGILHFDNEITWQNATSGVLPLPTFSYYGNLYIDAYLAKRVLRLQLGADVRYFTAYEAPTYTPAIGQYNLQGGSSKVQIGNYPLITAYINFCVKQTRFFLQAYHLNQSTGNFFTVPHYPLNPFLLKFGLSWNFFD